LFNLLKIIEYYDRNSIGQSRLQDLATQDTKHPLLRVATMGIKELINDSVGTEGDFKN
jgi:hypothetical protein